MESSKEPFEAITSSEDRDGSATVVPKLLDRYADESYKLLSQVKVDPPTTEEAERIRKKCVRWVIPFICIGYHLMYVDKQTLGNSAILGILDDAHLNTSQYNWLSSVFYFGYLIAEIPQNMALQRFPRYYVRVAIVRGAFHQDRQLCTLEMVYGFVAPSSPNIFARTRLMIPIAVITGGITVLYGILVWFLFPDNPTTAHFLTKEERAQSIMRIASNHSGIEQKRFKKHQFIEALRDPKTWLFFLHAWSQEMANGMTNQYSLIIESFGFSTLETTLLGCINGLTSLAALGAGAVVLAKTRNARAWLCVAAYVLPILSCILLIALPWSNRAGLLAAIYIRAPEGVAYGVVMIWAANCSAGHTKKTTVIALYHVGYGLGNVLSPQLFQAKYKPRYIVTWWVLLWVAGVFPAFLILYLRYYLSKENKRRDALAQRGEIRETGVVEHVDESGNRTEEVVDARQLDLTDRENLAFRYVL
ncbi:hypothetical protein VSDG_06848 [Cytospora chrysosperma]|uniref:Major facilitator superfamily (MFS) profile domain-containing protein n=1 Tax=Cytospora chrysosperma TaxID=252740 RepID=A0A423VQQ6_CYTCH|nr:hypothetical protein VSDG_06848 [Valsa sordida]